MRSESEIRELADYIRRAADGGPEDLLILAGTLTDYGLAIVEWTLGDDNNPIAVFMRGCREVTAGEKAEQRAARN